MPEQPARTPVPATGRATASDLPARDLVDVRLADLLGRPGCPACRGRAAAEDRFLDGWLYERVNDVATRRELDATRGLCERHIHALLDADRARAGGGLGTSILYEAMLRIRLAELDSVAGSRGRGRAKRLAAATASPDCMVCREAFAGERAVIDGLRTHLRDTAWAEATARAPLCLAHLAALMAVAGDDPAWPAVEARQLARARGVMARVAAFAHHSSHDRRHLRTADQEASVDEAAALLGRERPTGGRRG